MSVHVNVCTVYCLGIVPEGNVSDDTVQPYQIK